MRRIEDIDLAVKMCPKHFGSLGPREIEFWLSRARIAQAAIRPDGFRWLAGASTMLSTMLRACWVARSKGGVLHSARPGKVRLHPLPEGAPPPLAALIGAAVAGGIRDCLHAHPLPLSKAQRGNLIGSSRKRAVNQLVCAEGRSRLREALS